MGLSCGSKDVGVWAKIIRLLGGGAGGGGGLA